jgi:uncharacterized membrane protein YdjX (TVP38/TMEM64 family)
MANLRIRPRVLLRGLALLASLAALGWTAQWMLNAHLLSEQWIDAEVAGHGAAGYVAFIGVGALATALGFPRQVVAFLGGYAFGSIVGTEVALVATILGCIGTFLYARGFARSLLARRLAGRVRQFDEFVGLHPFQMTMIVRLLPVGSNVLTNLIAGVSRVRPAPFIAGSAVGYLPQTLAFALAGSGVAIAPVFELVLGAALFVASAVLGIALYRRHRHGTALEDAIDDALERGDLAHKDVF